MEKDSLDELIKMEIQKNGKSADYKYINDKLLILDEKWNAYCMDIAPDYDWINKKEEKEYVKYSIEAMKNGANVIRIIIVSEKMNEKIVNNELVRYNYINTTNRGRLYLVEENDVKKYCMKDYKKINNGFQMFETNDLKNREIIIDSFTDEEKIGYIINNETIIMQIRESFMNILNLIENEIIKPIELN